MTTITLREKLEKQLKNDYAKAPSKIWNQNNLEMVWSKEENLYIGTDSKGKEWIASVQHTKVPIFSVICTNKQRKGNVEINCAEINFVSITNRKAITCRKCKNPFNPQLIIPDSSQAYKLLEKLDK